MRITIGQSTSTGPVHEAHIATGGVVWNDSDDGVVLIHGAGMDGSVWQLQSRYLAAKGFRVAAVDLPAHGASGGKPPASIATMADWVALVITTTGIGPAHIVGHSMGTFIGLDLAARHPDTVRSLALLGTASEMPVHPALLDAATNDLAQAAQMMTGWSLSKPVVTGRNPTPGFSMAGQSLTVIEKSNPGVLRQDLDLCATHNPMEAVEAVADSTIAATVMTGSADKMTPARSGRKVAHALGVDPDHLTELEGVGHMMMIQDPGAVRSYLLDWLNRQRS